MNHKELKAAVGNIRGHYSSKENRAAKLLDMWEMLEVKFCDMVVKGRGKSNTARHAYAVLLMMHTGIRIGNEGSAEGYVCDLRNVARKANPDKGIKEGDVLWQHELYGQVIKTYGLTSLLHDHVEPTKSNKFTISFLGKKATAQNLCVSHPTLVKFKPKGAKSDLFLNITANSLKRFVRRYVGKQYTPKDLRTAKVNDLFIDTWVGNYTEEYEEQTTKAARKKLLSAAIEETAIVIGHTKGACKSSYLSSALLRLIAESTFNLKLKGIKS